MECLKNGAKWFVTAYRIRLKRLWMNKAQIMGQLFSLAHRQQQFFFRKITESVITLFYSWVCRLGKGRRKAQETGSSDGPISFVWGKCKRWYSEDALSDIGQRPHQTQTGAIKYLLSTLACWSKWNMYMKKKVFAGSINFLWPLATVQPRIQTSNFQTCNGTLWIITKDRLSI